VQELMITQGASMSFSVLAMRVLRRMTKGWCRRALDKVPQLSAEMGKTWMDD